MTIEFLGAARTVTGSKHLIKTKQNTLLLDCGFFQGRSQNSEEMNQHLGFDPFSLDFMVLSHAHIDHSGSIPNLVKQGFKGPIYCTPATLDLCRIMLKDSAHIQENDLKYVNKRRIKRGEEPLKPLYSVDDVELALQQFVSVSYNERFTINKDITLEFTDAGHILGSAAVHLDIKENDIIKKITFTGDIGRYDGAILKDPQSFRQCDILICESTYGDRLHSENDLTNKNLLEVITHTCIEKQGKLIIPAFSLGRTQELVFALDQLSNQGLLPPIPVYVDSPLSVNATNIMKKHPECFNEDIRAYMKKDSNPFGFDNLHYTQDVEESKSLNAIKTPCIIISASGMVEAGRIKHHVANNIEDSKNSILIVGYAEPTSIGGKIRNGDKMVRIFGEEYSVNADVYVIDSYSAHGDYQEMIHYLSCQNFAKIKHTFLVHGEYETQLNFKEKLLDAGLRNIIIPSFKDCIEC
jgi:metallo-beta-lactamase family protein